MSWNRLRLSHAIKIMVNWFYFTVIILNLQTRSGKSFLQNIKRHKIQHESKFTRCKISNILKQKIDRQSRFFRYQSKCKALSFFTEKEFDSPCLVILLKFNQAEGFFVTSCSAVQARHNGKDTALITRNLCHLQIMEKHKCDKP